MKKSILISAFFCVSIFFTGCMKLFVEEAGVPATPVPAAEPEVIPEPVYYNITVLDAEHGTLTADKVKAKEGESVTLTATADEGYSFYSYSVRNEYNDYFSVTENVFVMPAYNVTVSVKFNSNITANYEFHDTVTLAGTKKIGEAEFDLVYFGDWPKTIKSESVTVYEDQSQVHGAFTYYLGSDGMWYAKCTENPRDNFYTYSDGSSVVKGSSRYFLVEPIKWRVLTKDFDIGSGNKKALLLCEDILMADVSYYESDEERTIDGQKVYPNNYKESKIRAYLNGLSYTKKLSAEDEQLADSTYLNKGFLQTAFTDAAQNLIFTTLVDNSVESTIPSVVTAKELKDDWKNGTNIYACENTSDKIFLLSEKEAMTVSYGFAKYDDMTPGNARIKETTDFSRANNANQTSSDVYGGWWWIRSPYYDRNNNTLGVSSFGNVSDFPTYWTANTYGGIVPALCISFE